MTMAGRMTSAELGTIEAARRNGRWAKLHSPSSFQIVTLGDLK